MKEKEEKQEEIDRISGTLDAVAAYIKQKYDLNSLDSAKVATLLWLEQECDLADAAKSPELDIELRNLADFGSETSNTRGMVANSRVFINLNKTMAEALNQLPAEIVEDVLLRNEIDTVTVKLLIRTAYIFRKNVTVIPAGLACVCMRAWRCVHKQKHIPFQAKDVMPGKEHPGADTSRLVCELTQDDGRQRLGHANWQCPYHKDGNYCNLTPAKEKEILNILEQEGVLVSQYMFGSSEEKSYLFL